MNAKTRKKLRSRKYGTALHKRVRAELARLVASGGAVCVRCGEPIEPGTLWDVGHDDREPMYYSGPEHAGCNRGAPHRNVTSRQW